MTTIALDRYKDEAEKKKDNIREGKILFYGSSTFGRWETLENDMRPYDVVNNGFGGSTAEEALYYYYLLVKPFKPSALVYYEGDNDLTDLYTPVDILIRIKQFFKWVRTDFPQIPLFILLVKHSPSRKNLKRKRDKLNSLLINYALENNINIIDTNKITMCGGKYNEDVFMGDMLHFNDKGNALLANLIKQKFESANIAKI